MSEPIRFSKEIDRKINEIARSYYQDAKRRNADKLPEFRTMISGNMEDGASRSLSSCSSSTTRRTRWAARSISRSGRP